MKYRLLSLFLLLTYGLLHSQDNWSLNQCIDYALENNISINQLRVNSKIKGQTLKASKGALLPTVLTGASQSANFYGNNSVRGNNFTTSLNLVDANWTVFNGFIYTNALKKATIDQEIADKNIEILSNDVALNIANTYLQVLLNKELVNVAKNQLELTKRQLGISQKQLASGIISNASVFDVEATLANDEQTLVLRENTLLSSLLLLKQQLQLPVDSPFDVLDIDPDQILNTIEFNTPDLVYKEAVVQRPEISSAKLIVESADKNISIAKGSYLPNFSIGYGYGATYSYIKGVQNDNFNNQIEDNLSHSITANLSIPIFTGKSNKTNLEIAKLDKNNAELELENEKFNLRQNIETAYLDVLNAEKAYEASLKTLASREISLEFTEKRFQTGTVNSFDFETSKNNFIGAQSNVAQSKYDFIFKVKVLQFYAGNSFSL